MPHPSLPLGPDVHDIPPYSSPCMPQVGEVGHTIDRRITLTAEGAEASEGLFLALFVPASPTLTLTLPLALSSFAIDI